MRSVNETFQELETVQEWAEIWLELISPAIRDLLNSTAPSIPTVAPTPDVEMDPLEMWVNLW